MEDHETIIINLRKFIDLCSNKYNDVGSADHLTGFIVEHETIAWTLRRYLS